MASQNNKKLISEKVLGYIQDGGLLSQKIKGFESRVEQQKMMQNVIDAYNEEQIALIEAGTGTGKSVAYLIPALFWAIKNRERTVISTHTIALQEQLIYKDIPKLIQALDLPVKAVLVKGMNNYVCLRKLDDAKAEAELFPSEESNDIQKIEGWCRSMKEGSKSDLPFTPSPAAWEKVGAESDACPNKKCPHFDSCYFFKARSHAEDAHILVVNHSLLFSDLAKRAHNDNYDQPAVLPVYNRLIIDEAHHLEDVATEHLAAKLNRLDFIRTLGKMASEKQNLAQGKLPLLKEKLQQHFKNMPPHDIQSIITKLTLDLPALRRSINDQAFQLFDLFGDFIDQTSYSTDTSGRENKLRLMKEHQAHPVWQNNLLPQAKLLNDSIGRFAGSLRCIEKDLEDSKNEKLQEQTKSVRVDIMALISRIEAMQTTLSNFVAAEQDPNQVRWIEAQQLNVVTNVHLVDAKLDLAKTLSDVLFSRFSTIILTSATLTANRRFDFMRKRLGITETLLPEKTVTESQYDSPFNYPKQALLVIPNDIPHPSHPDYFQAANEQIWKAIQASQGNAFVLFTSYGMLEACFNTLKDRLKEQLYPLFKQGDEPRRMLLNKFAQTKRSVLFGTDSFWEGVDVAGDALRCVILVKLPFKVPSEPIIAARTESILKAGGDPFMEYSVPHAIVKFKQGFGRLIRNKWDRGCIVCLDARLLSKNYGKLFLNSLPNCKTLFADSEAVHKGMVDFYKKTAYLAINSPFK